MPRSEALMHPVGWVHDPIASDGAVGGRGRWATAIRSGLGAGGSVAVLVVVTRLSGDVSLALSSLDVHPLATTTARSTTTMRPRSRVTARPPSCGSPS